MFKFDNDDLKSKLGTKPPKTQSCICVFGSRANKHLERVLSLLLMMEEVQHSLLVYSSLCFVIFFDRNFNNLSEASEIGCW